MYDDIVKRLRELASIPEHCENVSDCDKCTKEEICLSFTNKRIIEVATQAADAIENLQAQLMFSNDAAKKIAEKVPKWIPVTERLPDNGVTVLAYYNGFMTEAFYANNQWHELATYAIIPTTYWMQRPEPPKGE